MTRALILLSVLCPLLRAGDSAEKGRFRVKYVTADTVYLDAGRNAGLSTGMKLGVRRGPENSEPVADLEVISVAATSAACSISAAHQEIQPGDVAYLSPEDKQAAESLQSSGDAGRFAQVVTFTEGDPLEEEARESVPRPPLPEVNRATGRITFEYSSLRDQAGSGLNSYEAGVAFRADITRIGGSYWNLRGYWRGRLDSRQGGIQQQTLNDLLNRTYHLTLYYDNPQSAWRAGFGRFYLPWASSLDTIDGGYLGRQVSKGVTAGIFAGTTPDPTSWNYSPGRQIFGSFLNYETGSFETVRYSGTGGLAFTRLNGRPERRFAFFENNLTFRRVFSIYHNVEVDDFRSPLQSSVSSGATAPISGVGVSRSFLTVRMQPASFLSLDLSHNYFRDQPTFDPRLIGTGLLDKLLFQGFSGGFQLDLPLRLSLYSSLGKSDRTGDAKSSWNQLYGLAVRRLWWVGARADVRYSRFTSAFGRGNYRSLMLTRQVGEALRFNVQAGDQTYASPFSRQDRARYINGSIDWLLAGRYILGGGMTVYRGQIQKYEQTYFNLGYRF